MCAKAFTIQLEEYANLPQIVNSEQMNRAWNDKKSRSSSWVYSTAKTTHTELTVREQHIYALIARQYLMQFCPDTENIVKKQNYFRYCEKVLCQLKLEIYRLQAGSNY